MQEFWLQLTILHLIYELLTRIKSVLSKVKRHDLLWPFDVFLPLAYRTPEFAGHKRMVVRQAWSEKQCYIIYKVSASSLMAFTIRN